MPIHASTRKTTPSRSKAEAWRRLLTRLLAGTENGHSIGHSLLSRTGPDHFSYNGVSSMMEPEHVSVLCAPTRDIPHREARTHRQNHVIPSPFALGPSRQNYV